MKELFAELRKEVAAKKKSANISNKQPKKAMDRKRKKNIRNIAIALVCIVAIVVTSVLLGQSSPASAGAAYQIVSLTRGDLSQSVTGTGSLALSDSYTLTLPADIEINEMVAKSGAKVSEGDVIATLDPDVLNQTINNLQDSVDSANSELSSYNNSTATSYISSNITGRVKIIYLEADDVVRSVMDEKGALMVISVDGYMKINVTVGSVSGLSVNQDVTITLSDGMERTGSISSIDNDGKSFTVLVGDYYPVPGEEATVSTTDGDQLGKGVLEINHPQYITGNVGTCKSIPVSLNQKVYNGTTLIRLKNLPISSDYETKLSEVESLVEQLNQAISYRSSGNAVTSPYDGILGETELGSGSIISEEMNTLTISDTSSFVMDVSVDELDILNISEGMSAKITVDALEDEIFEGEVTFISASGTSENGVTNYPVSLSIKADARLLPGMSATADIVIEEKNDVLLIPLIAINTMQGKSFVYKYNGESTGESSTVEGEDIMQIGTMTEIETGLSNDTYAEIVSGLTENDQVVVVRSEQTSENFMFGGGMGMQVMPGGEGPTFRVEEGGGGPRNNQGGGNMNRGGGQ